MKELLIAAAAALTISAMPAFADNCPTGLFAPGTDRVTCDNDDNRDDATGTTSNSGDGAAQVQESDAPNRLSDVVQSFQDHRGNDKGNQNRNN